MYADVVDLEETLQLLAELRDERIILSGISSSLTVFLDLHDPPLAVLSERLVLLQDVLEVLYVV